MAKSSSTVAVVVLTGDVDAATSPTWRERIEEAIEGQLRCAQIRRILEVENAGRAGAASSDGNSGIC